ncbi:hypothetical protein [Streptomyces avidinii]|uniref:terpene synthase family protein n=1 Tax=Streptomyces avidinii TaxID=1895 RepID=UPI00386CD1AA
MLDKSPDSLALGAETVLSWARDVGLVADAREERRLAAARPDELAAGALPRGEVGDVALTARWAAFVCWVDDQIDRRDLGSGIGPRSAEAFTAQLRQVFAASTGPSAVGLTHVAVLRGLWEQTAAGMSAGRRSRFTADYTDFLDACGQEAALRRSGVPPSTSPTPPAHRPLPHPCRQAGRIPSATLPRPRTHPHPEGPDNQRGWIPGPAAQHCWRTSRGCRLRGNGRGCVRGGSVSPTPRSRPR